MDNRNLQIGISVIHFNSTGTVGYFVQPALVKMSILERNGRKVYQQLVPSSRNSPVVQFFVSKESLMQSECLQLDGSLTFCCKIFTHVEPVPSAFSFFYAASFLAIDRSNGPSTRSSYLFNSGQTTDVIFKVRGRELPAHRRILIARSEVFAAMFQHPMEERFTNVAKIEDIDPDVFHELLHFIYTGQVQLKKLEKMAASLFIAADKYLLGVLKLKCENYLSNHISPENCAVLLFHGDLSITSVPLTNAAKYFRSFPHQVMSTNEWKKKSTRKSISLGAARYFQICLQPIVLIRDRFLSNFNFLYIRGLT